MEDTMTAVKHTVTLSERKEWAEQDVSKAELSAMLIYRGALGELGKSLEEDVKVMERVIDAQSTVDYYSRELKKVNEEIAEAEAKNNGEAV